MGMKRIYSCDICKEDKEPSDLTGIKFTSNSSGQFVLKGAYNTDGTHICNECMATLKKHITMPHGYEHINTK